MSNPIENKRRKVLIVDDDEMSRVLVAKALEYEGYQTHQAESGHIALQIINDWQPHLVLLDVNMPGLDGWGVLTALKHDPALADIPVVMLSIVDDRNLGYALGASEYLTKPLDRDRLLSVLKKYCGSAKPGLAKGR